jgi:molecular chaperone GrpE (heat shock protein)
MVEVQPDKIIDLPPEANAAAADLQIHAMPHANAETASPTDGDGTEAAPPDAHPSLQPILHSLEAVARAQFEQVGLLDRVEKTMAQQGGVAKVLTEAKQALEQRNVVSRAMFEALHTELKTYKDAFLLEAVLRPVIRDLISLYDDIFEIHRQFALALASQEQRGAMSGGVLMFFETVAAPAKQLEYNRDAILEVLERLDVTLLPSVAGKLDKQTQRAVALEVTTDPHLDNDVVKVTKRGFLWKERVIRAEEVVIKRLQDASSATAKNEPNPSPR